MYQFARYYNFAVLLTLITVVAGCPPPVAVDPPVASFTADVTQGESPLAVTFTDTSAPGGAPITGWTWIFGDGASSSLQHPQHTYTAPGIYSVALTVVNPGGSSTENRTNYITVEPPRSAYTLRINEFLASNDGGLADEDGAFEDWIEILNYGAAPLDLAGLGLTDDSSDAYQWTFPAITLDAGAYLVVFASGKDRKPVDGSNLHTSFRLDSAGEYLALFAPLDPNTPIDAYTPAYPPQSANISYGVREGMPLFFDAPTPGAENVGGRAEIGQPLAPEFSAAAGFHDAPLSVALSTPSPDATIRYTLDGSEPTAETGTVYGAPLSIAKNTVVRAAAFRFSDPPSPAVTRTFLVDVPSAQASLPALCLSGDPGQALYEPNGVMAIVGGHYAPDAFGVPAWVPNGPADYNIALERGSGYERAASIELVLPEGAGGFQVNCGLRVHGSNEQRARYQRSEDWTGAYEKFSFRFYFRGEYGQDTLDYPLFDAPGAAVFHSLILRGGDVDQFNPFVREPMVRETARAMGQPAARGRLVNLFINGSYKGYFELLERYDEDYFLDTFGGTGPWDVIDEGGAAEGNTDDFDTLVDYAASTDLSEDVTYQQVAAFLDLDNFIDYLLVELYAANPVWISDSWLAARERAGGAQFRFFVSGAEGCFEPLYIGANGFINFPVGGLPSATGLKFAPGPVPTLYRALSANADFRARFAARAAAHLGEGGALSQGELLARFDAFQAELGGVLPGMSTYIRDTWIPQREAVFVTQLQAEGLHE